MLARVAKQSIRLASYNFTVVGKDLPVKDIRTSDPFFTLMVDSNRVYKSEVVKKNLNPTFKGFTLSDSKVGGDNDLVRVEVIDKDMFDDDDHMGLGYFKISDLARDGSRIVYLSDEETNQSAGQLEIKMTVA